jgi:hypothetical protein
MTWWWGAQDLRPVTLKMREAALIQLYDSGRPKGPPQAEGLPHKCTG